MVSVVTWCLELTSEPGMAHDVCQCVVSSVREPNLEAVFDRFGSSLVDF